MRYRFWWEEEYYYRFVFIVDFTEESLWIFSMQANEREKNKCYKNTHTLK